MDEIKQKIKLIIESEQLDEMPEMVKTAGRKIKKFLSRAELKPFADEASLVAAFGAKNVMAIPLSEKYKEIWGEGETFPDQIFIDSDPKGVYLGCYFAVSRNVYNIDKNFNKKRSVVVKAGGR